MEFVSGFPRECFFPFIPSAYTIPGTPAGRPADVPPHGAEAGAGLAGPAGGAGGADVERDAAGDAQVHRPIKGGWLCSVRIYFCG